jgi:Sec7-like guanine-nucleotide exchange factor
MEVELPSETQQIDRVLQAFADQYHQCNPFIYKDSGGVTILFERKLERLSDFRSGILYCVFVDYASHRLLQ